MEKIKTEFAPGKAANILQAEYFYYELKPEEKVDLAIMCGGHERCAGDYEIERNSYPYYVVEYILSGKGYITIGNTQHELKAGTIMGFVPGVSHHYKVDPSNPMEHIFLAINGTEIVELFKKSQIDTESCILSQTPERTMRLFMKTMETGLEKAEFSQELCSSYLRVILLELASQNLRKDNNVSLGMKTYMRCKKYIDDNFSKIESISEVAQKCDINFRYMSRLFKKYAKIAPYSYIMRLKLNKAGRMLLTSDLPIKKIAQSIGFDDPFHFSRNFKKHHGYSPSEYRNMHIASKSNLK